MKILYFTMIGILLLMMIPMLNVSGMMTHGSMIQLLTGKPVYIPGEKIQIIGAFNPNDLIHMDLVNPFDGTKNSTLLQSDDTGHFRTNYIVPYDAVNGTWKILATSGFNHASLDIQVISSNYGFKNENTTHVYSSDGSITTIRTESPLQQIKAGVSAHNVKCGVNFSLVIKSEDGSPACVKPDTAKKLVERGWAKVLTTENTTLNALENNCGQFHTVPQDNHPNGSETYPVLILKQNSIGCAKLTYTINYNYNDNRSGSVWSQMLNFTDLFHIGKYNYTTHGNSFGVSSIDTMQMFKIESIPEVVDLAKYPVGSQFAVILVIQPLQNATGFYDYSIEEIPCNSYPLAVGYSPDQVNSSDFSKGMVTTHNHSCFNGPYLISSVQVSGIDFKQIKFP